MSTHDDPAVDPTARIHQLLDRYAAVTQHGLAALAEANLDGFDGVLAERRDLVATLDPLLASHLAPEAALDPKERRALTERFGSLHALDIRLRVALAAELQRVGQALDHLDGEEAVRSAYGQTPRTEGRTINVVR